MKWNSGSLGKERSVFGKIFPFSLKPPFSIHRICMTLGEDHHKEWYILAYDKLGWKLLLWGLKNWEIQQSWFPMDFGHLFFSRLALFFYLA